MSNATAGDLENFKRWSAALPMTGKLALMAVIGSMPKTDDGKVDIAAVMTRVYALMMAEAAEAGPHNPVN